MDNSGDHMVFNSISWPCIQANLGVTTEQDTILTTPPTVNNCHLYDYMETDNLDWPNVDNIDEQLDIYCNEFYNESGDFFNDVTGNRTIDDISNMAVLDVNEELSHGTEDFQDEEETEWLNNFPISVPQFPATSTIPFKTNQHDSWYRDPYGEDFINDIDFMEEFWRPDRPLLRWAMADGWTQGLEDAWINKLKKSKLNRVSTQCLLKSIEVMTDEELDDHETILFTIDTIKTPGQSNEGLKILYDYLSCRPCLDLRPYLEEFDSYLKRYIVWGINYYCNANKQNKNNEVSVKNSEATTSTWSNEELGHDVKMKNLSSRMLQCSEEIGEVLDIHWNMLIDWFIDAYDTDLKKIDYLETE